MKAYLSNDITSLISLITISLIIQTKQNPVHRVQRQKTDRRLYII